MLNELDPIVDQWYAHKDKGQRFYVTAIDEDNEAVEIQHFDGDLEELSFAEWRVLQIEISEEPENWSGAYDIDEIDDYGTEITDTRASDWSEPGKDFRKRTKYDV